MASPLVRISSSMAMKRARSQDSRRSQNASPSPAPVSKAAKTEEQDEEVGVPAFLRQSKAGTPLWARVLASLHALTACRYHGQVPRSRVAATTAHRTGSSRPILAMGSGYRPSSQASQSICECSALGKVKDTAQGSKGKIRLYQRFTHLTALCVILYLRVPFDGNLTAVDPAAASEKTYIVTQVGFDISRLMHCASLRWPFRLSCFPWGRDAGLAE